MRDIKTSIAPDPRPRPKCEGARARFDADAVAVEVGPRASGRSPVARTRAIARSFRTTPSRDDRRSIERAREDRTACAAMEITPNHDAVEAKSARPVSFGAEDATRALGRLVAHTGKAAWTFGTSFLVLVVPLIVQLHREEQLIELEKEQLGVLAQPSAGGLQAE